MQSREPYKTCLNVGLRQSAQHQTIFFHEILYICVSPGIGIYKNKNLLLSKYRPPAQNTKYTGLSELVFVSDRPFSL